MAVGTHDIDNRPDFRNPSVLQRRLNSPAIRHGFGGTLNEAHMASEQTRPRLQIKKWQPLVKNTLRGFATVRLPIGLVIRDITVHVKNDKAWASMPSKPILENGQHKTVDGKGSYAFILEWESRELGDGFSAAVVRALDLDHAGWRG